MPLHNRATLSIIGLYNWDEHIFDDMVLPSSLSLADIVKDILYECGELEVVYPDAEVMRDAIAVWSEEEIFRWNKIQTLAELKYNPIENYDRIENEVIEDNRQKTGNDFGATQYKQENEQTNNSTNSGSNVNNTTVDNKVTGFNTTTPVTNTQQLTDNTIKTNDVSTDNMSNTGTASSNATNSRNETESGNAVKNSRIHGNIGVSTPADMMKKELEIYPELNLHRIIPLEFKMRFCLLVY